MNVSDAYKIYTSLRLHFTTDNYDIRSGITPRPPKAGVKVSFKKKLEVLMKQYNYNQDEFINYLVANFLNGNEWGIFENTGPEIYMEWKRIQESLTYTYTQDVKNLAMNVAILEDAWDCSRGHPVIVREYCGKRCRLETLVILNKLYKFTTEVDEQLVLDPVWNSISRTIHKYSPFIKVEKDKFSMITHKAFYE
jgi:hypothetical protein